MSPPANRPALLKLALILGAGAGALEVGLRAAPRHGMSPADVAVWLACGIGLSVAYTVIVALIASVLRWNPRGLVMAGLIWVHAALWFRFELFLNEFLTDPRVIGGLLGITFASLILGLVAGRVLPTRPVSALAGLAGVIGAVLAFARSPSPAGAPADDRPNVLVITLDTTRPDHIGAYGSSNATPNIDRLAREGVRFDTAIATAPLTEPSHLAILTGNPPFVTGVISNGTAFGDQPALLSRVLQDAGWTTAGFVAGFPLHARYGWSQGFDVYDDDFGDVRGLHRLSLVKAIDQVVLPAHTLRERRGDGVIKRARSWLDVHADERFFLWVHLFDPHAPYEAPDHPFDPPTDGEALDLPPYWPPPHRAITSTEWLTDAYQAELRYTDGLVGELLGALEDQGVLDDTVVMLTADHGESLTEHDYLFDHGDTLFDVSLQVPWLVRYPAAVQAGATIPCQVSNMDIAPTVLGLVGVVDGRTRLGRDRGDALAGVACTDTKVLSSTVAGRFVAVPPVDYALRESEHKLIYHDQAAERGVTETECYALETDPGELDPNASCPPQMRETLEGTLRSVDVVSPEMDPTTVQALQALGYIDE